MPGNIFKLNSLRHNGYQNLTLPHDPETVAINGSNEILMVNLDFQHEIYNTNSSNVQTATITPPAATQPSLDCYYLGKYLATLAGVSAGALYTYQNPTFSLLHLGISSLYGAACGASAVTLFACCGKTQTAWPKTKILLVGTGTALTTNLLATLTEGYLPTWAPPLLITTSVVLTDALPKAWKNFTLWRKKNPTESATEAKDIELQHRTPTATLANLDDDASDDDYSLDRLRGIERSIHGGL